MYTLISSNNVDYHWKDVAPFVMRALERISVYEEAIDDLNIIRQKAMTGLVQIWTGRNPNTEELELVLITEGVMFGTKPILVCRWASGENVEEMLPDFGILEAWAKEKGFHKVQIWGRKGWEKLFRPLGYTHEFTVIGRIIDRGIH